MFVQSCIWPLLVELCGSLLQVILAGRLSEALSHDGALYAMVRADRWGMD